MRRVPLLLAALAVIAMIVPGPPPVRPGMRSAAGQSNGHVRKKMIGLAISK